MTGRSDGGWGSDPLVRALRTIAVLSLIAMAFIVVLDPDKSKNSELLILLFGSILLSLGYPIVMALPSIFGDKTKPQARKEDETG